MVSKVKSGLESVLEWGLDLMLEAQPKSKMDGIDAGDYAGGYVGVNT